MITTTAASTRVILTVRTGHSAEQTAFFDPDPAIESSEADDLLQRVGDALADGGVSALTLSGSSPSPPTHGLFSDMIALARARKVPVFLDTYGPALDAVWGFWPESVQLNRREAAGHLGHDSPTEAELVGLLERWSRHGVVCGVVTEGANSALVCWKRRLYRVTPPKVHVVNPIGSGDCLLAGLVDGWLSGRDPEDLIRHAFGCAAANVLVWDAGAIDPVEAARHAKEVMIDSIHR
jgi:fructose-1-phosphate kinase PfkB-like protein